MKTRQFHEMQMAREGYTHPNEHQVELYAVLGSKRFHDLQDIGFNIAYAERQLGLPPSQGSYQRDMTYNQTMTNALVYKRIVKEHWDLDWFDCFMEEFTEESCLETFRQKVAFKRLDELVRDNDGVFDLE